MVIRQDHQCPNLKCSKISTTFNTIER
ncbi:hypothetical protein [Pectobacterium brasiliense]|nr:hypothetical protein [Pectobacterium brasiliense]